MGERALWLWRSRWCAKTDLERADDAARELLPTFASQTNFVNFSPFCILGRQKGRHGVLLVCGLCDCAGMEYVFAFVKYLYLNLYFGVLLVCG